jgi:hypothetical protein
MRPSWIGRLVAGRTYRAWSVAALVVLGALVVAGVALATIPDANGVIHACYRPLDGNLRLIDSATTATCRLLETAISWNAQGPAGPTGPRGPSAAFLKDQRNSFGSFSLQSATFLDILTLSLPAGSYVVSATAAVVTDASITEEAQCIVRSSSTPLSVAVSGTLTAGPSSNVTIPLTTAFTLTVPDNVSLACRSDGPVFTQPSALTAIQVATLTVQ